MTTAMGLAMVAGRADLALSVMSAVAGWVTCTEGVLLLLCL